MTVVPHDRHTIIGDLTGGAREPLPAGNPAVQERSWSRARLLGCAPRGVRGVLLGLHHTIEQGANASRAHPDLHLTFEWGSPQHLPKDHIHVRGAQITHAEPAPER